MGKIILIFLFHLISFLLLLISCILIIIQSIKNLIFYSEKRKDIIAEKIIYEQFSHEVYSNINSKIYYDIERKSKPCDEGSEIIKFPLKFEYFYDCEDIDDDKIDKEECQNKITSYLFCCEKSCCRDYVFHKDRYHFCKNKTQYYQTDSRENVCSTSSVYNGNFYYINQDKFCAKRFNETYEELLSKANILDNCSNIITLDSKGNKFCDNDTIIKDQRVIVQNIFSSVSPIYIDIRNSLRVDILLNKKERDESKISEEIKKLNEMSTKNIKDAFFDKKEKYSSENDNYFSTYTFNMRDIISGNETIFRKYKNNNYAKSSYISWYYRNYIGFKNYEELQNFKKYFDENDHKNNSLYKFSTSSLIFIMSIISLIICIISTIIIVIYLIYKLKKMQERNFNLIPYKNIRYIILTISGIIFVLFFIIYLTCFICYFDYIDIDMEDFFEHVLEKYNKRRKQIYLLSGFIIAAINALLCILPLFFKENSSINKRPNNILVVKFTLENTNCEHNIKINKNEKLKYYINKMEKILEKCQNENCQEESLGLKIDKLFLNDGTELDLNRNIEELKINENSLLIIKDDE